MATIFTKIINGELPAHKIAEDDNYIAFLDISPLTEGHTLVIPKKEVDYIFDMEQPLLEGIMPFAGKVAKAIEKVVPCKRVGVTVIGLEVPHTHIHLIPMNQVSDMNFAKPKMKIADEDLADLAKKLAEQV